MLELEISIQLDRVLNPIFFDFITKKTIVIVYLTQNSKIILLYLYPFKLIFRIYALQESRLLFKQTFQEHSLA